MASNDEPALLSYILINDHVALLYIKSTLLKFPVRNYEVHTD